MGLATTGVCCSKQNRNFVGIEIYEPYYKLAEQRMKEEVAQMNIFDYLGGGYDGTGANGCDALL